MPTQEMYQIIANSKEVKGFWGSLCSGGHQIQNLMASREKGNEWGALLFVYVELNCCVDCIHLYYRVLDNRKERHVISRTFICNSKLPWALEPVVPQPVPSVVETGGAVFLPLLTIPGSQYPAPVSVA